MTGDEITPVDICSHTLSCHPFESVISFYRINMFCTHFTFNFNHITRSLDRFGLVIKYILYIPLKKCIHGLRRHFASVVSKGPRRCNREDID